VKRQIEAAGSLEGFKRTAASQFRKQTATFPSSSGHECSPLSKSFAIRKVTVLLGFAAA